MSTIILDASVAVKLVSDEPDSDVALERVAAATLIIAPDWMMIEASHALWKKVKASSLGQAEATAGIEALSLIVGKVVAAGPLIPAAVALSFQLPHPVYDCLYLALGEIEHAVVLTADVKFAEAARGAGRGADVEQLGAQ